MITAICPGSYDPVTNGHVDVIERAAGIFDRVVVGVVGNPHHKQPMFTIEERVEFLRNELAPMSNVEVDVFKELATFGGNIDDMVPAEVAAALKERLGR